MLLNERDRERQHKKERETKRERESAREKVSNAFLLELTIRVGKLK